MGTFLVDSSRRALAEGTSSSRRTGLCRWRSESSGRAKLTLRAMLSLEPATVTGRQYPLALSAGRDGLRKADCGWAASARFFYGAGAALRLACGGEDAAVAVSAPVGDPALGPTAYPHRASASEDPLAALGHHQEDSTHISDDVITVGWRAGYSGSKAADFMGVSRTSTAG